MHDGPTENRLGELGSLYKYYYYYYYYYKNACVGGKGNIKLSAFPKRVGPRILSLESVDYFGASEHY